MRKADIPPGIDDTVQRHTSQLEEIHFLSVGSGNRMVGVWQADEWDLFILPILLKNLILVGSYRQDRDAATGEPFVFLTQARQLRAAIGSHEAAQEGKHNRFAAKIR